MPESTNNKANKPRRDAGGKKPPAIETLDQFSDWIDCELLLLEFRHQNFETKESTRLYFQR
jgi:hypothetical protein